MTKDEARLSVMGAISMALKDPILQQGFEIICKNLSELEQENEELKDHLSEEIELHSHAEDYIKELEKQIEKMKCCGNCKYQCSFLFQDEIDCAKNGLSKWELAE